MRLLWAVEVLFRPVLVSGGEASPMSFVVVIWPEWVVARYKDLVSCVRSCLSERQVCVSTLRSSRAELW